MSPQGPQSWAWLCVHLSYQSDQLVLWSTYFPPCLELGHPFIFPQYPHLLSCIVGGLCMGMGALYKYHPLVGSHHTLTYGDHPKHSSSSSSLCISSSLFSTCHCPISCFLLHLWCQNPRSWHPSREDLGMSIGDSACVKEEVLVPWMEGTAGGALGQCMLGCIFSPI